MDFEEGCFCVGYYYFLFCKECNPEKGIGFFKLVAKTLYPTEFDAIQVRVYSAKRLQNLDGHSYYVVSVPKGDADLIRFLGYGVGIGFEFFSINEQQKAAQKLTFKKESFHPIDVLMGFYMQNKTEEMIQHYRTFTYSAAFCSFLLLRSLIKTYPNDEGLELDVVNYEDFHAQNNGQDSEQYAIANAMHAELRLLKGQPKGCFTVLLSCIRSIKEHSILRHLYWLLGRYCTIDYDEDEVRYDYFLRANASKYRDIARFYIERKEYHRAAPFVLNAFDTYKTRSDAVVAALVCCKLDNRKKARQILRQVYSHTEALKRIPPRSESKSDMRLCITCGDSGLATEFVRCFLCKSDWYCSQECVMKDRESHAVTCCRFCFNCREWIPKQRAYCSNCCVAFYCSEECQSEHWYKGGHRDECGGFKN
jgi:MYND finger